MSNTSIRVRLTIWYGGGLALIMLLFATSLYLVMSKALHDQIDQSLENAAIAAARSLEEHRFGPFLFLDDLTQTLPELARLDKVFQIFGPQGTVTLQSANIKNFDIPLSPQAKEMARHGIRVGAIAPGYINTEMVAAIREDVKQKIIEQIPTRRLGEPSEISHSVFYILENDYFTGRIIECDGGLRI